MEKSVKKKIVIYTDGACSKNPGPGGWCAILKFNEIEKTLSGGENPTTNNRMELMAMINGLKCLKEPCEVELYSDSAYGVNAFKDGWIFGWIKRGWKTADNKDVKNIELWQELLKLTEIHDVTFCKVKGHSDNVYNNRCDEGARNEIKKFI